LTSAGVQEKDDRKNSLFHSREKRKRANQPKNRKGKFTQRSKRKATEGLESKKNLFNQCKGGNDGERG